MVVIKPLSILKFSFRTCTTGAKQLVVHEAADIILSLLVSKSSLTPYTIVLSAFLHGAETICDQFSLRIPPPLVDDAKMGTMKIIGNCTKCASG